MPRNQEELSRCPGCGASLPALEPAPDVRYNASAACRQAYAELSDYTLSKGDVAFLHQLAVDAYAGQHAGAATRPITTAFALVGMYLVTERGYSGREVQRAHMRMAGCRSDWPLFSGPTADGWLTVVEVLEAPTGPERDEAIRRWGASVWRAWAHERDRVIRLAQETRA